MFRKHTYNTLYCFSVDTQITQDRKKKKHKKPKPQQAQIDIVEEYMPIIELPEENTVEEVLSPSGETKVQRTKKRTIKKKKGDKQETIEIITVDEDEKDAVVSVLINEIELSPDSTWPDEIDADRAIVIQELPEQETTLIESKTDKQKIIKKRTLKKKNR